MIKQKQKGFTLIELLITVGIVTALGAVIYAVVKKTESAEKVNSTISLSSIVLQRINDAAAVAPDYSKFGTLTTYSASNSAFGNVTADAPDALLKTGILPSSSILGKSAISPYGEKIGFYYSATPKLFFMTLPKIPSGDCVRIGQQMQNYTDALIVQSGGSGGAFVKTLEGDFNRTTLENECLSSTTATIVMVKSKE